MAEGGVAYASAATPTGDNLTIYAEHYARSVGLPQVRDGESGSDQALL